MPTPIGSTSRRVSIIVRISNEISDKVYLSGTIAKGLNTTNVCGADNIVRLIMSQSRKSVVIASAETLYCTEHTSYRYNIYIGRGFQIDFYECAHTQCFCKRSVGAYINAYAVCVIHRGRKQMFSQPVFGSPTRRLLRHCTAAIIYYVG